MLSQRQEQILNLLVKEYLQMPEPVSSDVLRKKSRLDVSGATIRNDLQELTEQGYAMQPHTSAGRVPTEKAYHYFVEVVFLNNQTPDLETEIEQARRKIEKELHLAKNLVASLTEMLAMLQYVKLQDKQSALEVLKIIGSLQPNVDRNISVLSQLMKELEQF